MTKEELIKKALEMIKVSGLPDDTMENALKLITEEINSGKITNVKGIEGAIKIAEGVLKAIDAASKRKRDTGGEMKIN